MLSKHRIAYLVAIGGSVTFALLIRAFWIEPFRISSSAMRPTLEAGDTIFVGKLNNTLSLIDNKIQRGDVVLFRPDKAPIRDFLKRVVGIEGDVVAVKAGRVWVNGIEATDSKLDGEACATEKLENTPAYRICFERPPLEDYSEYRIQKDSVFLIGDLRTRSVIDLRKDITWGVVPISTIKGKALWIWLSFEPNPPGGANWFPQLRFSRMFRKI